MRPQLARLFLHDGQQAVQLPTGVRFDADEVFVRLDPASGQVILSPRPEWSWREFAGLRRSFGPLAAQALPKRDVAPVPRDPFDTWVE